jgi:hypothetical protein
MGDLDGGADAAFAAGVGQLDQTVGAQFVVGGHPLATALEQVFVAAQLIPEARIPIPVHRLGGLGDRLVDDLADGGSGLCAGSARAQDQGEREGEREKSAS